MKGVKTQTKLKYGYEEKFGEFNEIFKMKFINKYDSKGNIDENSSYDSDGSFYGKYIYKYNSNGNRVEKSKYDSDGKLENINIYKYDSNGNEVEWSEYDSYEKLQYTTIYKYDNKNRKIESIKYFYKLKFGERQRIPQWKNTYKYEEY